MEGVLDVSAVACGSDHAGFVVGGRLHTYGSNGHQQLGHDRDGAAPAPVLIEAEDGHRPAVLQVALGAYHSAAVTEGGALWTWGWGGSFWGGAGALGHGTNPARPTPTLVQRFVEYGEEVRQVACGAQHTLVLTEEGRLYSTGLGKFGRLGRGEMTSELEFEEVEYFNSSNDSVLNPSDATTVVKVDAGSNFSAAMSAQGELWVWGRNDYGQIALGREAMRDMNSAERYPRLVKSLPLEGHQVVDFACGEHHVVALTSAGAIYEWGNRRQFEPQALTLPSRYERGLKNLVRVVAGDSASFALTADGRLYSWGSRASGCLVQDPGGPEVVAAPVLVPPECFGGAQVIDVAASRGHCLAITLGP